MAEHSGKQKKAKSDAGVLANLPSTRPQRMGRARDEPKPKPPPRARPKPKPTGAAKPAAKPTAPVRAAPQPAASPEPRGPRPVRAGAPTLSDAPAPQDRPDAPPSGTELVSTVVKAAGELAQIGLTVSGQVLRRAVEKLPKP